MAGLPEILTEENIREAYGVEVRLDAAGGRPYMVPVEPIAVQSAFGDSEYEKGSVD